MDFKLNVEQTVQKWSIALVILTILAIIICTLFPFAFSLAGIKGLGRIIHNITFVTNRKDIIGNLLLFLPLGFGLMGLGSQGRLEAKILWSTAFCSLLSASVEVLQLLLPERSSSGVDVLLNTGGGLIGIWLFQKWGPLLITQTHKILKQHLSIRNLSLLFITYTLITLFFAATGITINNWRAKFPLAIGNDPTGSLPWQGKISDVWMSNQALESQEIKAILKGQAPPTVVKNRLLAFYPLKGEGETPSQPVQQPKLIWKGSQSEDRDLFGVFTSGDSWLQTPEAATKLTNGLKRDNQFSLGLTFQADTVGTQQQSQLLSIAESADFINFSLGQREEDFIFRMRLIFTEKNRDTEPELRVRNVFTDTLPHRIVVTYTGDIIQIHIDKSKPARTSSLTSIFFMSKLQNLWFRRINRSHLGVSRYLYYCFIFVPLGAMVGMAIMIGRNPIEKILLPSLGFITPQIAFEYVFTGRDWQRVDPDNLRLSFLIMAGVIILITSQSLWTANAQRSISKRENL